MSNPLKRIKKNWPPGWLIISQTLLEMENSLATWALWEYLFWSPWYWGLGAKIITTITQVQKLRPRDHGLPSGYSLARLPSWHPSSVLVSVSQRQPCNYFSKKTVVTSHVPCEGLPWTCLWWWNNWFRIVSQMHTRKLAPRGRGIYNQPLRPKMLWRHPQLKSFYSWRHRVYCYKLLAVKYKGILRTEHRSL